MKSNGRDVKEGECHGDESVYVIIFVSKLNTIAYDAVRQRAIIMIFSKSKSSLPMEDLRT